jgi:hypothetical protein
VASRDVPGRTRPCSLGQTGAAVHSRADAVSLCNAETGPAFGWRRATWAQCIGFLALGTPSTERPVHLDALCGYPTGQGIRPLISWLKHDRIGRHERSPADDQALHSTFAPEPGAAPALLQQLDEGLRMGRRLMPVSAPAGFGKTTPVTEWISGFSPASWPAGAGGMSPSGWAPRTGARRRPGGPCPSRHQVASSLATHPGPGSPRGGSC